MRAMRKLVKGRSCRDDAARTSRRRRGEEVSEASWWGGVW